MGDRISIQFTDGNEYSVVFNHHCAGLRLIQEVREYISLLNAQKPEGTFDPIDRREPSAIMPHFIGWYMCQKDCGTGSIRLGCNESDNDNSDNGHFIFNLKTGLWNREASE